MKSDDARVDPKKIEPPILMRSQCLQTVYIGNLFPPASN